MDQSNFHKHSNINLLITQCGVFFVFLQQSGLTARESALLSFGYLVQILVGITIVLVAIPMLNHSIEAQVGIAFVVGSVVLVVMVGINNALPWWAVVMLGFLCLGVLLFQNKKSVYAISNWLMQVEGTFYQFCVINLVLISFFAGFRRELYLVVLLLAVHLWLLYKHNDSVSRIASYLTSNGLYLGVLYLSIRFAKHVIPYRGYGSIFLRPLYNGSDDQIFYETMSNSLVHHGLVSNMAAAGSEIKYHWFSLLWTGSLTELTDSSPFAVTLHALPLFCIFSTVLLVVALSRFLGPSNHTALLSVCVLFFGNTLFDNIPFYYVFSSTNIYSIVVLLSTFIIFVRFFDSPNMRILILLIVLSATLTLSKAPFMAVFALGVIFLLLIMRGENTRAKTCIVFSVVLIFVVIFLLCYLIFFRASWFNARYVIEPNFANDKSIFSIVSCLGLGLFVCTRLSIVHGLWNRGVLIGRVTASLCVGVSIASLSRFLVVGKTSENHLLVAGITLSAPLIAHTFMHLQRNLNLTIRQRITIYSITFLISGLFLIDVSELILNRRVRTSEGWNLVVFHPAFAAISAIVVSFTVVKGRSVKVLKFALILGFSVSSFVSYLSHSIVRSHRNLGEQVASGMEVDLFSWINENTPRDSLFATNRYLCHSESFCAYDDSSQLLAALSRRSIYIEGPRFVTGGHPYANWVKERIELSIGFADNPTSAKTALLKSLSVDYFLLDERFTETRCAEILGLIRTTGTLCLIKL